MEVPKSCILSSGQQGLVKMVAKKNNSYHNKPVLICFGSFKLLEFFFVNISKIKKIKIKLAQKLILLNLV